MSVRATCPPRRTEGLRHRPPPPYASLLLAASAPITYVSAQLGHANPSTTLRFYAKWIPSKGGRRWVDLLDRIAGAVEAAVEAVGAKVGTRMWNQNKIEEPRDAQLPGVFGVSW